MEISYIIKSNSICEVSEVTLVGIFAIVLLCSGVLAIVDFFVIYTNQFEFSDVVLRVFAIVFYILAACMAVCVIGMLTLAFMAGF